VSEAKFEDFEDFGMVSRERFRLGLIRSNSGDKWWILEMYKSDNDADLHTQSIAMRINGQVCRRVTPGQGHQQKAFLGHRSPQCCRLP
jgi:hypothetical protein